MYELFYKLKAEPFRLSPDHKFCYGHEGYARAKAYMAYAFVRAEGFVMVTGRPGTGKTTLIADLVESLADERITVATLVCTQLEADDLLRMVAFSFGIEVENQEKSQVLQRLTTLFSRLHRRGRRALLIVDEAQDLSETALEELRLLTNLQMNGEPLLQIFLLGQEELRELVQRPTMVQVQQRIVATCHLQPLQLNETREYILHRLLKVGWMGNPALSEAIYPIIYGFSEGVPRRINLICSRLFLHGSVEQRDQIGVSDAREVIAELQMEQLAAGSVLNDADFSVADEFLSFTGVLASLPAKDAQAVLAEIPQVPESASPAEEFEEVALEIADVQVFDDGQDQHAALVDTVSVGSSADEQQTSTSSVPVESDVSGDVQPDVALDDVANADTVAGKADEEPAMSSHSLGSAKDDFAIPPSPISADADERIAKPVLMRRDRASALAISPLTRTVVWGLVATLALTGAVLCVVYWQLVQR